MRDVTGSLALAVQTDVADGFTVSAGSSYDFRDARTADNPSILGTQFATADQDAFNVQAGVEYALAGDLEVYAGASRKSRFATMFERYSYRLGFGQPNPALKPERLTTIESGVRGRLTSWLVGSIGVYWGDAGNYIQAATIGTNPAPPFNLISQSQNIGKVEISGVEMDVRAEYDWLSARLAYTYLDRDLKNRPGAFLFGTPHNKLDFDAQAELGGGLFAQGNIAYRGSQLTTDTGSGNPIDSYIVAGLKAGWRSDAGLAMEVAVSNLFDKLYEYDDGYPGQGRSFSVTLRQQF